jgi:twinkle protein
MKNIWTFRDLKQRLSVLWTTGLRRGDSTGWQCVDDFYTVTPGLLTIVTGWPGSGKSEWVDALALNLIRQDWRFAVYSPENRPIQLHASKLVEKWIGKPFREGPTARMDHREVDEAAEEIGNAFGWLDPPSVDNLQVRDITELADIHFADVPGEYKRGLIIDPWNELDHARAKEITETEYISQALSWLRNWARTTQTHVWLVAHPAKQRRENGELPVPRPDMIAGSQHFWNKADNAVTVYRDYARDDGQIDIHVQKVRFKHVGRIGVTSLTYDRVTGRYHEAQRDAEGRPYGFSYGG